MDPTLLLIILGFTVVAACLVTLVVLVRASLRAVRDHRDVLERANQINAGALQAALEANELAREANRQSRESVDVQLRTASFPHIFCEIGGAGSSPEVIISNQGRAPAFNLRFHAFARYSTTEAAFDEFTHTYTRHDLMKAWARSRGLGAATDRSFTFSIVYERFYRSFPAGRRLCYPLDLPLPPESVYVLMQYESTLGHNYLALFEMKAVGGRPGGTTYTVVKHLPASFVSSNPVLVTEMEGRYVLLPEGPYVFRPLNHDGALLRIEDEQETEVDVRDTSAWPEFLKDDGFIAVLEHSFPSRYLKRAFVSGADREVWTSDIHSVSS